MVVGVCHALASFILLICPNVIEFRICTFSDPGKSLRYITAILEKATETGNQLALSNFPRLQRLRTLAIYSPRRTNCPDLKTIFSLLMQHPFTYFEGSSVRNGSWRNNSLPIKLQLTSLRFYASNLSTENFGNFLHHCPDLKILHYEHDQTLAANCFLPQEFGMSIGHLKTGLAVLILYRGSNFRMLHHSPSEFATIGSLAGFQRLKTLSISTDLLLGPQNTNGPTAYSIRKANGHNSHCCGSQQLAYCLPKSLENLLLQYCVNDIFGELSDFLRIRDTVTPRLKSITLIFPNHMRTKKDGKKRRQSHNW
jgi:hypothetical protein